MNLSVSNNINNINYKSGINNSTKNITTPTQPNTTKHLPTVRANQLASKGLNFTGRNIGQLYEEYNWFINHDHEKPIHAFLKIKEDPQTMDNFLGAILATEDRSYQFIDSIVRSGKELSDITVKLRDKLSPSSPNMMTFMPQCPYTKAYKKYITQRFDNAHTMSEILRMRPDWSEEALLGKYERLKPGESFRIGKIPNEFPIETNTYDKMINHLKPNMQFGFKQQQEIPDLTINNRNYKFESFTNGKSDKNVFCVTVPEGKKFVIKMGKEEDNGLNKPFGLGTLSLIDTYLTTNRSKNSAPLRFYDRKRNVSIYEYIEHCPVQLNHTPDIIEVNNKLSDFKKLGLMYNDTVGSNNYYQLADAHRNLIDTNELESGIQNQEWISVDNDHVTFSSILHPQIEGFHKSLPNMMGMCC